MKINSRTELTELYPRFFSSSNELRSLMIPFSSNFGTYRKKISFGYLSVYWACSAEDPFAYLTDLGVFVCDWLDAAVNITTPPPLPRREDGFVILDALEALRKFQLLVVDIRTSPPNTTVKERMTEEDCRRILDSEFWTSRCFSGLSEQFSTKYEIYYSAESLKPLPA